MSKAKRDIKRKLRILNHAKKIVRLQTNVDQSWKLARDTFGLQFFGKYFSSSS